MRFQRRAAAGFTSTSSPLVCQVSRSCWANCNWQHTAHLHSRRTGRSGYSGLGNMTQFAGRPSATNRVRTEPRRDNGTCWQDRRLQQRDRVVWPWDTRWATTGRAGPARYDDVRQRRPWHCLLKKKKMTRDAEHRKYIFPTGYLKCVSTWINHSF